MSDKKSFMTKQSWKDSLRVSKSDWGKTIAGSVVDIVCGIAGATGGSFLGIFALPAGAAMIGAGHKTGHRWLTSLGIGCVAAPFDGDKFNQRSVPGSGFDLKAEFEAGKERMKDYLEQLKGKFTFGKAGSSSSGSSNSSNSSNTDSAAAVAGFGSAPSFATLDQLTRMDWLAESKANGALQNGIAVSYPPSEYGMSGITDYNAIQHII
jgi:hypothetical protein